MEKDIIERLREGQMDDGSAGLLWEAADEIERLRAFLQKVTLPPVVEHDSYELLLEAADKP